VKARCPATKSTNSDLKPYWGYEDIGAFWLLLVLLNLILRLLVRFDLLAPFAAAEPGLSLQVAVVTFLSLGLYSILKVHYKKPVLAPLGWVMPRPIHIIVALTAGPLFAAGITLYLRFQHQEMPPIPALKLIVLGLVLGPMLEESLFRGCLLPVLTQTAGTKPAVIITAILFALFHGPANWAHWLSFTAMGLAYGCTRVVSRSTTAPALMHAAYNLALFVFAAP
jgi:membrane protease YdiL (CAAX protease family)